MKKIVILLILMFLPQNLYSESLQFKRTISNTVQATEDAFDTLVIYKFSKTAKVNLRSGYLDENQDFVSSQGGKQTTLIWMDVKDDPDTLEDETSFAFTDFIGLVIDLEALDNAITNKYEG
jgi:hypothetical protein